MSVNEEVKEDKPVEGKVVDPNAPDNQMHKVKPPSTCAKGEHYFVHKDGREVECSKCHAGYYISPGTDIREGHIYIQGVLAI